MGKSIFFDAHMHAMSISHPNYIAFIREIESNFTDEAISGMFSSNYIASASNATNLLSRMQMILSLMDRSIGEIFLLIEDDLSSPFTLRNKSLFSSKPLAEHDPFIHDGAFHFHEKRYDNIGLCPMIMDFTRKNEQIRGVYSYEYKPEKLIQFIEDTKSGIEYYHKSRPEGLLRFFPFLGINPTAHALPFIIDLFETYLITDKNSKTDSQFCHGVKLYPPLDFNPWPEGEPEELEKVCYIYEVCTKYHLPITTHCDDQGFRSISPKKAWDYSSPKRWEAVLEHYPELIIDFAHFGWQYRPSASLLNWTAASVRLTSSITDTWYSQILQMMVKYENVYTDFSFSGASESFYKHVVESLKSYSVQDRKQINKRIMFGSDYFLHLSKVDSYSHYFSLFDNAPFSAEQFEAFASKNVFSWLSLNDDE